MFLSEYNSMHLIQQESLHPLSATASESSFLLRQLVPCHLSGTSGLYSHPNLGHWRHLHSEPADRHFLILK